MQDFLNEYIKQYKKMYSNVLWTNLINAQFILHVSDFFSYSFCFKFICASRSLCLADFLYQPITLCTSFLIPFRLFDTIETLFLVNVRSRFYYYNRISTLFIPCKWSFSAANYPNNSKALLSSLSTPFPNL